MKNILNSMLLIMILSSCGEAVSDAGTKSDGVKSVDHRIFVTSEALPGDFGKDSDAFTVADAKCMELAKAALLTRTYKAVISTEAVSVLDNSRLVFTGAIYTVDAEEASQVVAESGPELWLTRAANLQGRVQYDENGVLRTSSPWTGTGDDGSTTPGGTCTNWTVATGTGFTGSTTSFGTAWVESTPLSCGNSAPIYCISQ